MKILVISSNYPSSSAPQRGTFVYKLIQEFVAQNNIVTVISADKIQYNKEKVNIDYGEELANVYRPKFISFSNRAFFHWNSYFFTRFFQARVIRNTIVKNNIKADVIYCHFISSALLYFQAFPECSDPLYVAVGEYHNIDVVKSYYKSAFYKRSMEKIAGFIAVSPQVKNKLLKLGLPESKIIIEPNATDLSLFVPLDKMNLRRKYNFPLDKKLVLFVGRFIENKGPLRVLEALNLLSDEIIGVFVGKGPQQINGNKVLFNGPVLHHKIPEIMSMADVFVMPSEHEGSSNVIVEAMACGLPIVSSNIPEIQFQCDPSFSILVDPLDINEIKNAIWEIISNENKRKQMSLAARKSAEKFGIKERAKRILSFIENPL